LSADTDAVARTAGAAQRSLNITPPFATTPGGYSHGMVAKAKAGELNLSRTIWGLRSAGNARPSRPKWSARL